MGGALSFRRGWAYGIAVLLTLAAAPALASARIAYVPNVNGNPDTVSTIDTAAIAEVGSPIPLGLGNFAEPRSVAVTPDGARAYVANWGTANVSVIDAATRTVIGSAIPVGGTFPEGIAITPDGTRAYVVNRNAGTGSVTPIDLATNTAGAQIVLPANTYSQGIAITPDGTRAYVTNGGNDPAPDSVSVIDLTTNTPTGAPIPVGNSPHGIAITPDGSTAYVALTSGTVSVIDTATKTVVGTIPVNAATSIAIAPAGSRAYVVKSTNPGAGVVAIDTATNTTTGAAIPMDASPGAIAMTPSGARGFVAGANSNRVRAFDTATNAAVGSPVGPASQGALGIAITPDQGPSASFSVAPGSVDAPIAFDASGSTDPDGTVARYDWDFGDGTTLSDGGPSPSHAYAAPGTYAATLTVTDNEGCSTRFVYTGQTASCNAGDRARTQQDVVVGPGAGPDTTPPNLLLGGPRKQKLDGGVELTASCDEACTATAAGTLLVRRRSGGAGKSSSSRRRFALKGTTAQIAAGQEVTLTLVPSFGGRSAGTRALRRGGGAKAKITVTAVDGAANSTNGTAKIKFKRPHR